MEFWINRKVHLDADVLSGAGSCATDFFDSKGTGWSHDAANGEYDCDGSQVANSSLVELNKVVIGTIYRVTFTVKNYVAGNVFPACGNTGVGTARTADGTYTEDIIASGNTYFYIFGNTDFVGSVDDITVEPVRIRRTLSMF